MDRRCGLGFLRRDGSVIFKAVKRINLNYENGIPYLHNAFNGL